ncbi:MAG: arsenate reductase ArsC [Clostridia bacterium]
MIQELENIQGTPKVAFVCNHNSCRSQMAEALGKSLASDTFESYSAGTIIKDQINQDAVRLMKKIYDIDMEKEQFNKTIFQIPKPDVVIFMGCNVSCPSLNSIYNENWGLDDPSGKSDEEFEVIIKTIHEKVLQLSEKLTK